jgi:AraC-like DNA-binding protein
VLRERTLLNRDGIQIADVACRHEHGQGGQAHRAGRYAVVFIRRGCFVRSADGVEGFLDPTGIYCIKPGQEQRYDHPLPGGDDCTSVRLAPRLLGSLWGGEPALPSSPLPSSTAIDLQHRLLLTAARRGNDQHTLVENAILLTAATLAQHDPGRVKAARPATVRARRALADATREALLADPGRSLTHLAEALAVSPHHLSRLFRTATGHTISRHRIRLRVRAALEQLAAGNYDLASLAADLGFADQGHLSRVIRHETGHTPSALRHALAIDKGRGWCHRPSRPSPPPAACLRD